MLFIKTNYDCSVAICRLGCMYLVFEINFYLKKKNKPKYNVSDYFQPSLHSANKSLQTVHVAPDFLGLETVSVVLHGAETIYLTKDTHRKGRILSAPPHPLWQGRHARRSLRQLGTLHWQSESIWLMPRWPLLYR